VDRPTFSVVVPTYNRREALAIALDAWERQVPTDIPFEVVVVDDGSTDGTAELLAARRSDRYRLRAYRQDNAGPAAARSRALALVEGDFVLFTGDDIEPDPRLLAEHRAGHDQAGDPDVAILGLTRWPEGAALTATMRHIDGVGAQQFSYHYFVDGAEYDFRHFYTSNVSLRRRLLELEPDGFRTDFPAAAFEDAELAYRLSMHGMRIRYRAAARADHHHHYDAVAFFARQRRCGAMAAVLYRLHPALKKWLDIRRLEWRRIESLAAARSGAERSVQRDLERWEQRALSVARLYDRAPANDAVDALLHPLFEYAYLAGLADALFPPPVARAVRAVELVRLLPPAVRELERRAAIAGVPVPRSDVEPLARLGGADS
jgi:glycosyltransferase involved in cell wall biosynthesis